jgi:hypothetical protein
MTLLFGTSAKQIFVDGWSRYVKPGPTWPPAPAPPEYYWNPRTGNWYKYPTSLNKIEDKGWPQVDLSFAFAGTTYDQITTQYQSIPADFQKYACWDPRLGKWMSVASEGSSSEKGEALTRLLNEIHEFHHKGFLSTHATDQILTLVQREM